MTGKIRGGNKSFAARQARRQAALTYERIDAAIMARDQAGLSSFHANCRLPPQYAPPDGVYRAAKRNFRTKLHR